MACTCLRVACPISRRTCARRTCRRDVAAAIFNFMLFFSTSTTTTLPVPCPHATPILRKLPTTCAHSLTPQTDVSTGSEKRVRVTCSWNCLKFTTMMFVMFSVHLKCRRYWVGWRRCRRFWNRESSKLLKESCHVGRIGQEEIRTGKKMPVKAGILVLL